MRCVGWVQKHAALPRFSVGAGDENSALHTCAAGILLKEPFPSPKIKIFSHPLSLCGAQNWLKLQGDGDGGSQLRMYTGEKDARRLPRGVTLGEGRSVCRGLVGGVSPLIFGKW